MGCQVSWRPVHVYEQAVMEGRITLGFNKKKNQNYLEKIPVRNPEFSWKEDQQGIVTVDMVHKGIFDKLAQKLWVTPRVSHVKLDRFEALYGSRWTETGISLPSERWSGKNSETRLSRCMNDWPSL